MELKSPINEKACRPYCEFKTVQLLSPTLRSLLEARSFFHRLTTLFYIPVDRVPVSNFKQFIHERSKYIVIEALI